MSALNRDSCVLITGATGLIGGEVFRALVGYGVGDIWTLMRPRRESTPVGRLQDRMRRSDSDLREVRDPVHAVAGDTRVPGLGLSFDDASRIRSTIHFVVHCADATSFIRNAECVNTNIAGMRNLIDFVRQCRRAVTIVYVSTAANSGAMRHACLREEDGCQPDRYHHNEYTRTKAVAEKMLMDSGLPALVVRPSIVLSAGLPDREFARAILWFMPLLRYFDALPVDPLSKVDLVPVEFVAKSIVALMAVKERQWMCYHLTAGPQGSATCEIISQYIDSLFRRVNPLRLVPPEQWDIRHHRRYVQTRDQRKVFGSLRYYLPFINMDVVYDNARLSDEIGIRSADVPLVTEYLGDLLRLITIVEGEVESLNP